MFGMKAKKRMAAFLALGLAPFLMATTCTVDLPRSATFLVDGYFSDGYRGWDDDDRYVDVYVEDTRYDDYYYDDYYYDDYYYDDYYYDDGFGFFDWW